MILCCEPERIHYFVLLLLSFSISKGTECYKNLKPASLLLTSDFFYRLSEIRRGDCTVQMIFSIR